AEKGTEKLVSTEQPAADLLKIAHHGSASSTNADLHAVVHPKFAVISVGARNVYHHPRTQVLERLQQAGAVTYRTDINGASTFYLDGGVVIPRMPELREPIPFTPHRAQSVRALTSRATVAPPQQPAVLPTLR